MGDNTNMDQDSILILEYGYNTEKGRTRRGFQYSVHSLRCLVYSKSNVIK